MNTKEVLQRSMYEREKEREEREEGDKSGPKKAIRDETAFCVILPIKTCSCHRRCRIGPSATRILCQVAACMYVV
jgi:hypothetical protein